MMAGGEASTFAEAEPVMAAYGANMTLDRARRRGAIGEDG